MLTSQTDRKPARKTYIQLIILRKKSEKFVLTTQNCPVCTCQRDDMSVATAGRARLVGKAGCRWRLRVPLASLFPAGSPKSAAPHWWVGSKLLPYQSWRHSPPWSQNLFYSMFFLPLANPLSCLPLLQCVFLHFFEPESWCPVFSRESPPVLSLRWNSRKVKIWALGNGFHWNVLLATILLYFLQDEYCFRANFLSWDSTASPPFCWIPCPSSCPSPPCQSLNLSSFF